VKFTAGPQLWAYLQWLAKNSILGKTPGEVAQQVLVQRLSEMKAEDFKAKLWLAIALRAASVGVLASQPDQPQPIASRPALFCAPRRRRLGGLAGH